MPIGRHPLVAAGRRIRWSRDKPQKIKEESWEQRAWDAYDRLPELHYGSTLRSNIAHRFDYFPARRPGPTDEPNRLGEVDEDETIPGNDQAVIDFLDGEGGPELIRRLVCELVVHFDVAGRAFLVADTDRNWEVLSTLELGTKGKRWLRIDPDDPDDQGTEIDPDQVYTIWRPHPRNHKKPDSPLRASLEVAEQLILLNREMRARSISRLPAGLLLLSSDMDLGGDEETDPGDPIESFQQDLTDHMSRPISDAGSAASLVPWVITADPEDITAARHMTFDRDWDVSKEDREELIRRLANGMDLPPEILLGVADLNHWSLWGVQETTITQHVDPTVRDILDSLTIAWFIPLLQEAGIPSDGVMLWRDITPAVVPPDRSEQHVMAMRMGLIGFDAARERLGYDTDESPTLDDLELIGWLIGRGDPSTGVPVEIGGQRGVPQTPRPGQAPPPAALVAAAPRTVSLNELTDLDTGALEYTVTQAEAALDRVIEKAGARLRSKAQSNPTLLALSDGVPNRLLPQTLKGRFAPTDVVSEADFDAVRKRILARWRRTATQAEATLARLVDAEPADPQQVDEDMRDGDSRLLAVLLAAALAALFTPDGTPDPAEVGEARDTRVPVTELREAMSIAGGGAPSYVDAGAWELIAGGRRTDQALRGIGAVSAGFEWRYGDPASRVRNFEPHQRLNGVRFETWTDDRLTVTADGSWVGGTHYRPGDHRGCLCLYTREVTLALAAAGNLDPAL